MVFLRAFTDDSASEKGDLRLFMAGYLNRAEKWALFSEAWDEELRASPSIEYLKMSEAQHLKDQFKGWSSPQRDEKLRGLARVIRHFKPVSFEFSIDREEFYRVVKPVSPRGLGNPHFTACMAIVWNVARFSAQQGGNIPIEFIFDKQDGVDEDFNLVFEFAKKSLPKAASRLIRGKPRFEDDKQLLPLQAADLLVWHLRREHEDRQEQLPLTDLLRAEVGHVMIGEIDSTMMQRWADHHSQQPGVPLLRSKTQWQEMRKTLRQLNELGFIPPYGSRWKNTVHSIGERIARFFRR